MDEPRTIPCDICGGCGQVAVSLSGNPDEPIMGWRKWVIQQTYFHAIGERRKEACTLCKGTGKLDVPEIKR
jgi:hypothetical protein